MTRRRGFVLLFTLVALFLMAGFAVLFARFSIHVSRGERIAMLNTQSDWLLNSAATWLQQHRETLRPGEQVVLPLADWLPRPFDGALKIQHLADHEPAEYEAALKLSLGPLRVNRAERWQAHPDGQLLLRTSRDSTP